jgi:uncharacterized protein
VGFGAPGSRGWMSSVKESDYTKPLPRPDRDSAPYWEYLAAHELRAQRCLQCAEYRWPARELCSKCCSLEYEWALLSGRGALLSWTVVHHLTAPGFKDEVPYNVGIVQLEESPELVVVGNVVCDYTLLRGGLPVRAGYDDVVEGVTLLRWIPSTTA